MDFENLQKKSIADLRSIAQMMQLEIPERCSKVRLIALITGTEQTPAPAPAPAPAPSVADAPKPELPREEIPEKQEAPQNASKSRARAALKPGSVVSGRKQKNVRTHAKSDKNDKNDKNAVPAESAEKQPAEKQLTEKQPAEEPAPNAEKSGKKQRPEPLGEAVEGLLEILQEGYGFIRVNLYYPGNKDIYVAPTFIRKLNLKTGDYIAGRSRTQRDNERYQALCYVESVNGMPAEQASKRKPFESLTPIYPDERICLETVPNELSTRLIDLMAPIGKGQRGMIVSPPKAGKTVLLKKIANAVTANYPDIRLIVLLIDERPEEVTDMRESIKGEVVSSTFDELPERHIKVAELVFERARRLVEMGEDVVILMDSLTRLARAYNITISPTGRSLSGGLDPGALYNPKRFFGAARNIRDGGSLTIVATALIDTGSKMDDVIFEEFKGTGNMELHLDRKLSEKRIFPAIDINKSGTRKEELLLSETELNSVYTIRKAFTNLGTADATEMVVGRMLKTRSNADFIKMITVKPDAAK